MELEDCAFPTLAGVKKCSSDDLNDGFGDCNWVICVGSIPRKQGMERADLIRINGPIFTSTARRSTTPQPRTSACWSSATRATRTA